MLNSVGLQGPGVEAWLEDELPALVAAGARVVASIWGRTVEDYEKAADAARRRARPAVVAVEVNLCCPNLEDGRRMFAHRRRRHRGGVAATAGCGRPRWAKLSPNVTDLVEIADAAGAGGAEAVTLVNTVMGMAIDPVTRPARLGGGRRRAVGRRPSTRSPCGPVRRAPALPDLPIVGVGGVVDGRARRRAAAGRGSAVQVGTATFADPRAPVRVLAELEAWCRRHRRVARSPIW